ncbi:cell division inhibitor SepF [Clostridium acidisoli DSM 12555]|jgi:cell division inhibitor SepF|uniref:Cell division protein SepF n=1 Tax=Clostridium acidisoli DSM 12555 TaxID=1121291 RepID=A0A1W1X1S5_9CLOT|nr:cell division protein SepF [Clostridium acidisoli]SMC17688.1 cell division inhibitor SepF [Clostridium acidisoli DSM 12555]
MAKVLNKVMGILGLDDGNIDDYEEESSNDEKAFEREYEEEIDEPIVSKRNSKVVNIHTNATMRVIISRPKDYDEATTICDELKNRKIIVVNVSDLEPKIAQRLLDFMGGASYVLNGELQEVEKNVYILSPSNVEVTNELKTEISGKGMFAWTK